MMGGGRAERAIILAAGRGSRLRSLTDERPKCLLEVGGTSILEWQIAALSAAGIKDIVIVRGYRGEMLVPYATRTVENADWATTNMVWSLMLAAEEIDRPVIVSYSDIIYSTEIVRALAESTYDAAISYDLEWRSQWARRFEDPLSDAETFVVNDEQKILELGGKTDNIDEIMGQYMGLIRLTPSSLKWMKAAMDEESMRRSDMTSLLNLLIKRGHSVYGVPGREGWCEVDSPEDAKVAEELVAEGRIPVPAGLGR